MRTSPPPPPLPCGKTVLALAVILLAHSLWVLSDARFLDGTYFEYLIELGNWDLITWHFYRVFLHPWAWVMIPFLETSHAGWFLRALEWVSVGLIGLSVLRLAWRHGRLGAHESFFLALAVALFPSYSAAMMSNTFIYILPTGMFFLAWSIYMDDAFAEKRNWWRAAAFWPLLTLSFFHNSLLAFHFGFVVLLLALRLRDDAGPIKFWPPKLVGFAKRHVLLLAWPFLFLAFRSLVLASQDSAVQHYQVRFELLPFIQALAGNYFHHVVLNLYSVFFGQIWLTPFAALVLALGLVQAWRKGAPLRQTLWIAAFGIFFSLLAVAPYALVARAAPLQSFGARYGILAALGGGLILLAAVRILPERLPSKRVVSALLLIGLAWRGISDDLMWLGRWAKDKAVMSALAGQAPPADGTYLLLEDDWRIGRETYRPFELSWFFIKAWGRGSWLGVDLLERSLESDLLDKLSDPTPLAHDFSTDFRMNGCTRRLVVSGPATRPDPRLLGLVHLAEVYLASTKTSPPSLISVTLEAPECREIPELLVRNGKSALIDEFIARPAPAN